MRIGIAAPIAIRPFADRLDLPAFVRDGLPQGLGGTPIVNLVQSYLKRNRDVVVFTLDKTLQHELTLDGRGIRFCILPCRTGRRGRDLFGRERSILRRAIQREKPDIVHAHWTYEFAMAALDTDRPVLVTAHDAPLSILRYRPDPYRLMRTLMAIGVARRSSHLTAVSPHVARHFQRYLRYRHRIDIVPNAIAPETFALGAMRGPDSGGRFNVVSILTGWGKLKNGHASLEAFAIVRRRIPNARLILIGEDYAPGGPAERWATRKKLNAGVEFVGAIPNRQALSRLAREADVVVHPSLEEAFGMTVAEAMTLGLPVIGGNRSGGVPWMLKEGKAGMLVDVTSPTEIASGLIRLADDPALRQQLGTAAKESARQRFWPDTVAEQYEAIYDRLLHPPTRTGSKAGCQMAV